MSKKTQKYLALLITGRDKEIIFRVSLGDNPGQTRLFIIERTPGDHDDSAEIEKFERDSGIQPRSRGVIKLGVHEILLDDGSKALADCVLLDYLSGGVFNELQKSCSKEDFSISKIPASDWVTTHLNYNPLTAIDPSLTTITVAALKRLGYVIAKPL